MINNKLFFLGDWQVNPKTNTLRQGELLKQLEPKAMDVLCLLCLQQGQVLSADEIVEQCWGNAEIGDNPVHKAITQLRKAFDDKPSQPTYIETIRKRGYRIIAELNFPLDDDIKAQQGDWQGKSPFPGLSAFEPDDAQVFFGRNEQIHTLLERISKQVTYGRAFCLILGPSGSGKSSLVNAGILPRLLNPKGYDGIGVVSYASLDFADIAEQRLFIDLASAMLDWDINGLPVFDGMSADSLAELLQSNCAHIITLCKQALAQAHFAKPQFFLFIDRLEVLLSSPFFSDAERTLFLDTIETLATSGCIMLFSACRNDFYPLVVNHSSLMAGKANGAHFDLLSPHRSELMQMIRLPAIAANLSWSLDPDSAAPLDEILCSEAANNPDSLPMLQYTLQELYLQRSTSNELQFAVYQTLGGIEGAIGKKAEALYLQLPEQQQAELAFVLSLLVTLNPDGETITSRAARWSQLTQASQTAFVQAMVDSRLFVSHLQNNEACFSLAHEALLRRWPRASQWISEHQDSLAIKSRLQQLSQRWISEGKSSAYLLADGKPLQEALSLQGSSTFTLDSNEQALIQSSLKRAKTKRWLSGITIVLLCILTFTAVLMSIQSQQAQHIAQKKRLEAESLLGFMVGEFADKLRSVKRMDLLDGISNKALEYFSQQDSESTTSLLSFANKDQDFKAQYQHAQTLGAMGEVAYSRGKNDEARQAFNSAKVILDKLYKQQADNLELLKTLGANAFWLGQLAMDSAAFNEAKSFFELYLRYSQVMVELEPDNIDTQWELSYAYLAIGSSNSKLQQHTAAKTAFETTLNIQQNIVETLSKDDISRSYIADTLEWIAESEEQLGHLQQALKTREKVQVIISDLLAVHNGNGDLLESLAYSYINNANVLYYLGDYATANQSIESSITHLNTMLGQDPSNHIWQLRLISAKSFHHYLVKLINNETSLPATTITEFQKLLGSVENSSSSLAITIKNYQINGDWELAQQTIDLAKPKLMQLINKQPQNSKFLTALSHIYLNEAKQALNYRGANNQKFNQQKENSDAARACHQAIALLQPIIIANSSYEVLLPYVQAYDCLGELNKVQNYVTELENMQIKNYRF